MSSVMKELLRLTRKVDAVELILLSNPQQTYGNRLRSKRDTNQYMSNVIQVKILIQFSYNFILIKQYFVLHCNIFHFIGNSNVSRKS